MPWQEALDPISVMRYRMLRLTSEELKALDALKAKCSDIEDAALRRIEFLRLANNHSTIFDTTSRRWKSTNPKVIAAKARAKQREAAWEAEVQRMIRHA